MWEVRKASIYLHDTYAEDEKLCSNFCTPLIVRFIARFHDLLDFLSVSSSCFKLRRHDYLYYIPRTHALEMVFCARLSHFLIFRMDAARFADGGS